jgi:hypothetical protein
VGAQRLVGQGPGRGLPGQFLSRAGHDVCLHRDGGLATALGAFVEGKVGGRVGGPGVAYPPPGRTPQPLGDAGSGGNLADPLGEWLPGASRLGAQSAAFRLRHTNSSPRPPQGRSRGRVRAEPLTWEANTPRSGKARAPLSAVVRCTVPAVPAGCPG